MEYQTRQGWYLALTNKTLIPDMHSSLPWLEPGYGHLTKALSTEPALFQVAERQRTNFFLFYKRKSMSC